MTSIGRVGLEQGHVRLVQHVDEEQHGRHDFPSAGPQSRKSHDCSGTPLRLPGAQAQIRRRFALIPVAIRSTSAIAAYDPCQFAFPLLQSIALFLIVLARIVVPARDLRFGSADVIENVTSVFS